MSDLINNLLLRSSEYEAYVISILRRPLYETSDRTRVSNIMCEVSLEHAESIKTLLAAQNFTSAIGLLRLQYESYVRGLWVFYAASNIDVSKLTAVLNEKNQQRANNLPMLSKMIERLKLKKAPKEAIDPILEFKEISWKPLSSYVHGGLHVVDRHSKGYPIEMLEQALKASNGVNGMVAIFGSKLRGNTELTKDVYNSFNTFADCFQKKSDVAL